MAAVKLMQVRKDFGGTLAVDRVSLAVRSGEFVTLLGPSGCGKTTTLRIVAGLTMPDGGTVRIGDADVTHVPTSRRNIGMVFQGLALFPHMTVTENVAFGLAMRRVPRADRTEKVRRALDLVRLASLGDRYPRQLSGGQQQRVALARAVVFNPDVLLLDEPFGALDRKLREAMQIELADLISRIGITALFVTHDQEEALVLSDRIAVMHHGRLEQLGTPAEIFERPRSRFVADFMGATNFVSAKVVRVSGREIVLDADGLRLVSVSEVPVAGEQKIEVALRPEKIRLTPERAPGEVNGFTGVIESATYHGTVSSYVVQVADRPDRRFVVREQNTGQTGGAWLAVGARVSASWDPEAVYLLCDD